ncbi:hypothetical protein PMEGAPR236_33800 [Priestia megaterium]|jgi:hypothetical protein
MVCISVNHTSLERFLNQIQKKSCSYFISVNDLVGSVIFSSYTDVSTSIEAMQTGISTITPPL